MLISYDKKNDCFNFYKIDSNKKEELKFSIKGKDINNYFEELIKKIHTDLDLLNQIYIAMQEFDLLNQIYITKQEKEKK